MPRVLALALASTFAVAMPANADDRARADALLEEGNQLGAGGNYEQAIQKFREADALVSRPVHACNIGLAYVRLSLWAPAHYYLSKCKATWTDGALPAWVGRRIDESTASLKAADFSQVMIVTTPAAAKITVSPFPGEELFSNELWLPLGVHTVVVKAEGFATRSHQLVITSRARNRLPIELEVAKKPVEPVAETTETTETTGATAANTSADPGTPLVVSSAAKRRDGNGSGWLYAGIGSGVAATGLVVLGVVFRSKASAAAKDAVDPSKYPDPIDTTSLAVFNNYVNDVSTNNSLMVGSFITAGLAAGASAFFLYKWRTAQSSQAMLTASPTAGGAAVSASWRF